MPWRYDAMRWFKTRKPPEYSTLAGTTDIHRHQLNSCRSEAILTAVGRYTWKLIYSPNSLSRNDLFKCENSPVRNPHCQMLLLTTRPGTNLPLSVVYTEGYEATIRFLDPRSIIQIQTVICTVLKKGENWMNPFSKRDKKLSRLNRRGWLLKNY